MTKERDPRIDPVVGDVLHLGDRDWKVLKVSGVGAFTDVIAKSEWFGEPKIEQRYLRSWRRWAKDAEVMKRGDQK